MNSKSRRYAIAAYRDRLDCEAREILREQYPGAKLDDAVAADLKLQAAARPVSGLRRRTMLKGVGAAALLSPFVGNGVLAPRAKAQSTVDNLLIITWPCGIERPWAPPAGTLDSPGPVDSRSSVGMPILAPLTPYFDRLLIATDMASANDTGNLTLDHGLSTFGMWTGNTPKESSNGRPALQRGPSFEQLIGAKLGEGLSFKTVHVGVHAYGGHPTVASPYVHYAGESQPITAENNTLVTYGALMNLVGGGAGVADPALGALKLKKRSVLDYITGRISKVKTTLDSDGQKKLDAHLSHVRALEVTLANRGMGTCSLPGPPAARQEVVGNPFDEDNYNRGGQTTAEQLDFVNHVRDQINTLGLAFQCGLTKVATLQLSNTDCRLQGTGMPTTTHGAAHFGNHDERMKSSLWWMGELRDVLDTMAAYDLGNGQTMLDTTLVVLASEMGVPEHGGRPPFMIIGGQSGFFKRGVHVELTGSPRPNRLMLTLMRACGIEQESIGDASGNVTGLLTEIMA